MSVRRYTDKGVLRAARDVPLGDFNSRREFSDGLNVWGKLKQVAPSRLLSDQAAYGTENVLSHTFECRCIPMTGYMFLQVCGGWYKILNAVEGDKKNTTVVGLIYQDRCGVEEHAEPLFGEV